MPRRYYVEPANGAANPLKAIEIDSALQVVHINKREIPLGRR
jgi:hypothetical protein